MKKILIDAWAMEPYRFFRRLAHTFRQMGFEIHFLTQTIEVYLSARRDGETIHLTRNRKAPIGHVGTRDPAELKLVRIGLFSPRNAKRMYYSTWALVNDLHKQHAYEAILVFSGNLPSQIALGDFAAVHGIKKVFFEIGNMPNKIFADPEGTNACSMLYRQPDILDGFAADPDEYMRWRREYEEAKTASAAVPQAAKLRSQARPANRFRRQLVYAANICAGIPQMPKLNSFKKKLSDMTRPRPRLRYDDFNVDDGGYVFFPMQIRLDAQTLLHSDIDGPDAIRRVAALARRQNSRLLVKPHPAETDPEVTDALMALREELGFDIVNANTFRLLQSAREVYTLNSTVGLEGLILGKKVTFMGRSLFAHFADNPRWLRLYVMRYLLDADYFGETPVSEQTAAAILERAEIQPAVPDGGCDGCT